MSIKVMSLVYSATLGSATRKAVALKLADHADDNGRSIYPSVATIAAAIEVDRSTVQRTLKQLCKDGFLEVAKKGGGRGNPTLYRINLPWIQERIRPIETAAQCSLLEKKGCTETVFPCSPLGEKGRT